MLAEQLREGLNPEYLMLFSPRYFACNLEDTCVSLQIETSLQRQPAKDTVSSPQSQ